MQWLAQQIMHDRYRAVAAITVTAMLALMLPPLGILSAAAVALVVLRNGVQESVLVTALGLIAVWLLGQFILGNGYLMVISGLILWVPSILLGGVLRWSRYMPWVIEGALLIVVIVFGLQYLMIDDPVAFWSELLTPLFDRLGEGGAFEASGMQSNDVVAGIASTLPMLLAIGLFLQLVIAVLIGRWWQAMLYNPGGFREEFQALRLSRAIAIVALPIFVASIITDSNGFLAGVGLLVISAFAIQGLAVAHALLNRMNAGGWLIGIYVLLLFAGPYMLMLLGFAGYADVWSDFRQRHLNKLD